MSGDDSGETERVVSSSSNHHHHSDTRKERITVVVRIKPLFKKDQHRSVFAVNDKTIVLEDYNNSITDNITKRKHTSVGNKKQFVFDAVFGENTSQEQMYNFTAKYLINEIVCGYNGTVIAYGATGSGKTYTLMRIKYTDEELDYAECGIIIQSFQELFHIIGQQNDRRFIITASYLEIYNENIKDLFNNESGHLEIRGSSNNVQIMGLKEVEVRSVEHAANLLLKGNEHRSVRRTAANSTSSRSHAILIVILRQAIQGENDNELNTSAQQSKLLFVDLAGSERARHTKNKGKKLQEGSHINKSLLALSNCISALSSGTDVTSINFRDSKLTRLLREPLSGNYHTVMIAQVNPDVEFRDETKNTLIYASKASGITKNINRNTMHVTFPSLRYQKLITELRDEVSRLKNKLNQRQTDHVLISENSSIRKLKDEIIETFEEQMKLRKQIIDIDSHILFLKTEIEKHHNVVSYWQLKNKKLRRLKSSLSTDSSAGSENTDKNDITDDFEYAWSKLNSAEEDFDRYQKYRNELSEKLKYLQDKTKDFENTSIVNMDTNVEKEILTLLCRVYELEADKLALQGDRIIDIHELGRTSDLLMKYQNQQKISDNIITKQRQLIEEENIGIPSDLHALYDQYQREIYETTFPSPKSNEITKTNYLPVVSKSVKEPQEINQHSSATHLPKVNIVTENSANTNSLRSSPIPVAVLFPPITF